MATGGCGTLRLNPGEAFHDVRQALVQIVAVGGHGDGFGHRLVAAHGGETEVGAARVEGHDDAVVWW